MFSLKVLLLVSKAFKVYLNYLLRLINFDFMAT